MELQEPLRAKTHPSLTRRSEEPSWTLFAAAVFRPHAWTSAAKAARTQPTFDRLLHDLEACALCWVRKGLEYKRWMVHVPAILKNVSHKKIALVFSCKAYASWLWRR